MRGFFGGVIVGLVVTGAGAAVLSLLSPLAPHPVVSADAPPEVAGATEPGDGAGVAPVGRDADLVEAAPAAPGTESGTPDDLTSLEGADTQPADKPAVGGATGGMDQPSTGQPAPEVTADSGDAPAVPQAPAPVPAAPQSDGTAAISTDPAQPAVPAVTDAGSGFGTLPEQEKSPEINVQADEDGTPQGGDGPAARPSGETAAGVAPQAATDPGAAPEPATETTDTAEPGEAGDPVRVAESDPAPEVAPVPAQPEPQAGQETAPQAATETTPPRIAALPQTNTDEDAASPRPRIGTPVRPLTERGQAEEGAQATEDAAPQDAGEPPIRRFAAPFENPENRPLMSILLIDEPESVGAEALQEFPYPLSFAIDPTDPQAIEKMKRYRAAGFEVTLLTNLPAAAQAQDAEVSMSVWLMALNEVVAIVEGTGSGIQGNRALSDQVADIALNEGLGLVTQANGLNTAQKLATRAGVPAAVVFRDFDGAGQSPTVMRRFLDQAAFRAGQEGTVIMLGRVRPDTISALLLWGLQDRAQRVALAPISAALLRE